MKFTEFNKLIAEQVSKAKAAIPQVLKEAGLERADKLNSKMSSHRPTSIKPFHVSVGADSLEITVKSEAILSALPGRLIEVVNVVAPLLYKTDNIYREVYSAAKRLGINSALVRSHLREILEAAEYKAKADNLIGVLGSGKQETKKMEERLAKKIFK